MQIETLNKVLPLSLALFHALPVWASGNEEVPAGEEAATRQIERMIEDSVRVDEAKYGSALRDAHAKAHACVQAKFRVLNNLPEKLRVGIFADPRAYPAWIRYSNASGKVQNDSEQDARGMAVKLMGIEGSESGTQDFLMINHPVFFVRNAVDYLEFQKAVSNSGSFKFFFPGFNPLNFRLHEFGIVNAIRNTEIANPLFSRYWSTTPYLFGENTSMKFSVRPCTGIMPSNDKTSSQDFLRENMQKQLTQGEACFDFLVQLRNHPAEMPIEDPTLEWKEKISPFSPVARITIPAQQFNSPQQQEFCENLSFTPWHALPEFRPLGGINRVRKTIYDTVSRVRHELNGEERREPAR